jgi:hypothetical protein
MPRRVTLIYLQQCEKYRAMKADGSYSEQRE